MEPTIIEITDTNCDNLVRRIREHEAQGAIFVKSWVSVNAETRVYHTNLLVDSMENRVKPEQVYKSPAEKYVILAVVLVCVSMSMVAVAFEYFT